MFKYHTGHAPREQYVFENHCYCASLRVEFWFAVSHGFCMRGINEASRKALSRLHGQLERLLADESISAHKPGLPQTVHRCLGYTARFRGISTNNSLESWLNLETIRSDT